jgi:uncharacterized membrane protein YhaH (DUF805 family)
MEGTALGTLFAFEGRIGRGTFWGLSILLWIVGLVGYLLLLKAGAVGVIVGLLLLIPSVVVSLATQVKRWHDRNKSGWWILIALVPVIGGLWALIETGFLPGTEGPNAYGNPDDGSPFS